MRLTSTSTSAEAVAATAATVAQLVASNLNFIITFLRPVAVVLLPALSCRLFRNCAHPNDSAGQVYVHTHRHTHTAIYIGVVFRTPHAEFAQFTGPVSDTNTHTRRHRHSHTLVLLDVVLFIILKAKAASCLPSFRFGRWASAERWQRASRSSEKK